MHVQVCNTHDKAVHGAVIKHKKKRKGAVNASDHTSMCAWNLMVQHTGFRGCPALPGLGL